MSVKTTRFDLWILTKTPHKNMRKSTNNIDLVYYIVTSLYMIYYCCLCRFSRCLSVVYDGSFLHALSSDAVNSYTTHVGTSAMARKPFIGGVVPREDNRRVWLSQVSASCIKQQL